MAMCRVQKMIAQPFSISELFSFDEIVDWPCAYNK